MKFSRNILIILMSICLLMLLAAPRIGVIALYISLMSTVCLILLSIKLKNFLFLLILITAFGFFQHRSASYTSSLHHYEKYYGQTVELRGRVLEDATYGYRRQVEFFIENVELNSKSLVGKVKVAGYGQIEVKRGDIVSAAGRLRPGFGSYQASISYADYNVVSRNHNFIDKFRYKFISSTLTVMPEPHASLGLGFIAGFRSLLPESLETALAITGLTHIVAVSGYNTTIIANFIRRSLERVASRLQVIVLTSLSLVFFLFITGLAPSIVRASVVSGLTLLAWLYGRKFNPFSLLLLSAVITAYMRPLDFWFSLGWWLSFTAFFGILMLAPLIVRKFKIKRSFAKLLVETGSAQLLTMPIILWSFSEISAVALITNLLVLPLVPFAMLFTFLASLGGLINYQLGGIISLPARFIIGLILQVINYFSQFDWALISLIISRNQMLFMFLLIGILVLLGYMLEKKRGIINLITSKNSGV